MNENTFQCYTESSEIRKSGDHIECTREVGGEAVSENYNEVSAHTGQNGHHQKGYNNKCWSGSGGKGASYAVAGTVNGCSR